MPPPEEPSTTGSLNQMCRALAVPDSDEASSGSIQVPKKRMRCDTD